MNIAVWIIGILCLGAPIGAFAGQLGDAEKGWILKNVPQESCTASASPNYDKQSALLGEFLETFPWVLNDYFARNEAADWIAHKSKRDGNFQIASNTHTTHPSVVEYFDKVPSDQTILIVGCGHFPRDPSIDEIHSEADWIKWRDSQRTTQRYVPNDHSLTDHGHGSAITLDKEPKMPADVHANWTKGIDPKWNKGLEKLYKEGNPHSPYRFRTIHFEWISDATSSPRSYENAMTHLQPGGQLIIDGLNEGYYAGMPISLARSFGLDQLTAFKKVDFKEWSKKHIKQVGFPDGEEIPKPVITMAIVLKAMGFETIQYSSGSHPVNQKTNYGLEFMGGNPWLTATLPKDLTPKTLNEMSSRLELGTQFVESFLEPKEGSPEASFVAELK